MGSMMGGLGLTVKDVVRFVYVTIGIIIATTVIVTVKSSSILANTTSVITLAREVKEVKKVALANTESIKEIQNTGEKAAILLDAKMDKFEGNQDYILVVVKAIATDMDVKIPIKENSK